MVCGWPLVINVFAANFCGSALFYFFFAGVKNIEVDLGNQVVRVLGTTPVKELSEALDQTGRKSRLIGQGIPNG